MRRDLDKLLVALQCQPPPPLAEFVDHMQRLLRPGGLFGAEFMMPVEKRHNLVEHYTSPNACGST